LKYLFYGNVHGVSPDWLSKRLDYLFSSTAELAVDPNLKFRIPESTIVIGARVFKDVLEEKSGRNYFPNYDCEQGMASFLYASNLGLRPTLVVETGVANGISTNVIMKTL
jgi:hypothetical protein